MRALSHAGHLVCTRCCGLRSFETREHPLPPDLCDCLEHDAEAEFSTEQRLACTICATCALAIASGHTKWRTLHCARCRPLISDLNERAGRLVVPLGIHSIVNSIACVMPATSASPTAFADQLGAMFVSIRQLGAHRDRVVARNLRATGLDVHETVDFERYVSTCLRAGIDSRNGWAALVTELIDSTPASSVPSDASGISDSGIGSC